MQLVIRNFIILFVLLVTIATCAGCGGSGTENQLVSENVEFLSISISGRGSDLMGPIGHLQGNHNGDAKNLSYNIVYIDPSGYTVLDKNGVHYYDDLSGEAYAHEEKFYPERYYGVYPLYYMDDYMNFEIHLMNIGNRTYKNLRVIAIQEYLNEDGQAGERMGPDCAYDWYIPTLKAGQAVVLKCKFYIPYDVTRAGMDQTHIQVQHWMNASENPGDNDECGNGRVIIDDAQAAMWCPPSAR